MKHLKDLTSQHDTRTGLISDCTDLINTEVKSKKGLSGAAIKAAFAIVKAIKPRVIEDSVDGLLDEFTDALQPYYTTFQDHGEPGTLEEFLKARAGDVAESLLAITDKRAERAKNKTMVKAYRKLRPKGKTHVELAAPGIGGVLDRHVSSL